MSQRITGTCMVGIHSTVEKGKRAKRMPDITVETTVFPFCLCLPEGWNVPAILRKGR